MKKVVSLVLCLVIVITCISTGDRFLVNATAETVEHALFPGNVLQVTQGAYGEYNSYSHNGQGGYYQNAFDLTGNSNYYAPFSGTITKIKTSYNAVVLQSDNKVYWANGVYDYMSVCFVHDNDISDLYVGKHIRQGEIFYQPGVKDPGGYTSGPHLHICVNRGKTDAAISYFTGDTRPNEAFFIKDSTTVKQTGGYTWAKHTGPHSPWIKLSADSLFLGESISFTFGATNATSYKITVKHLDEIVKEEDNVKSGVSYTFTEEGSYTAYITAKNGSSSVTSETVNFYIVNSYNLGSYFITKLNNPASGFYVASEEYSSTNQTANVYLASPTSNSNNEWKFIRQNDGSYKVINLLSNHCLSVSSTDTKNGTNICCLPDNNEDNQRWYIRKNMDGYALVPKTILSSDLSITGNGSIYGDCIFDGANITLYENDSVQSQRFVFEYTVQPIEKWIKIDKTKATSKEKIKFEFNGSTYAKSYTLHVDFRDGSTFEKNIQPGEELSFDKSGQCNAYIIYTLEDATKLYTETVSFYNMLVHDFGQSFRAKIKNTASNFYVASTKITSNYCNIIIASQSYNDNNIWRFDRQEDGSYRITNEKTGLLLDLYGGSLDNKTNIIANYSSNAETQRWFITSNMDGYALAPKNDYTKYLSVFENDTIWWYGEHTDGASIVLYELDNVQSQRFEFEKTFTYGDCNENGEIDATDALLILRAVVGKTIFTDEQKTTSDVDGDGEVSATDALLILKKIVGKVDRFPVEG